MPLQTCKVIKVIMPVEHGCVYGCVLLITMFNQ